MFINERLSSQTKTSFLPTLIVSIYLALLSSNALAKKAESETAHSFFSHYLEAYDNYSVPDVLEHYADQVLVAGLPNGSTVMTKKQLNNLFTGFLGQQKSLGVVSFEWESLDVHMFSDILAISSNIATRHDGDGNLISRAAATMQAYRNQDGWKITGLTLHDDAALLPLNQQTIEAAFTKTLELSSRPDADKQRDTNRQPQSVMQFADIQRGMTVLDLIAAGGYYTEVLSHRVGSTGKVYAHNTEFVLNARNGAFNKELTMRLAKNRLPNVERLDRELGMLGLTEVADAMTMVLNYHDFYNQPELKRRSDLTDMRRALKRDGVFVVIDSNAKSGPHNADLHRINREITVKEIQSAGFTLTQEGYFLSNPKDPLDISVFDKSIRGQTDRFVLLFKKS